MTQAPETAADMTGAAAAGGRSRKLAATFTMQAADLALRIVLQLVLVQVLIRHWGIAVYQDWLVLFAAANILLVLDCGMQSYFVNTLLLARVGGDEPSFRRSISVAMFLYLVVMIVAAVSGTAVVAAGFGPAALGVRILDTSSAGTTVVLLAGSVLALIPLGIFTGVYRVSGDYSMSVGIGILTQSLPGFAVCLIAMRGGTPVAAGAAYAVAAAAAWLIVALDQRRRYGEFPIDIARPSALEFKATLRHAAQYMISSFAAPLTQHVPVLILGFAGSAGAVVLYTATRTLTGLVRQIVFQPSLPVGVEMARVHFAGRDSELKRLFVRSAYVSAAAAGLLGGGLVSLADPVLRLWTHGEVSSDPWLLAILAVNVLAIAPAQIAQALFLHINVPRPLIRATGAYVICAVVLCVALVPSLAARGAAFAFAVAEIAFMGAYLSAVACRTIGVSFWRWTAGCGRGVGLGAALGYGGAVLAQEIKDPSSFGGLFSVSVIWMLVVTGPAFLLLLDRPMRSQVGSGLHALLDRLRPR